MNKVETVTASKPIGIIPWRVLRLYFGWEIISTTLPDKWERVIFKELLMGTNLSGLKKW